MFKYAIPGIVIAGIVAFSVPPSMWWLIPVTGILATVICEPFITMATAYANRAKNK